MRLPPPELNLVEGTVPDAQLVRAFVQDAREYISLARWTEEPAKQLYISSALKGAAKSWHLEWASHVGPGYTAEQCFGAILERFAPEVRPRAVETRQRLSEGQIVQGSGENLASYSNRLEALYCWVPDASEGEKMHYFRRGLRDDELCGECTLDQQGQEFASYSMLKAHALVRERCLYAKHTSTRSRSALKTHAVRAPSSQPPAKRQHQGAWVDPAVSVAVAAAPAAAEARRGRNRRDQGPASPRAGRGGQGGGGGGRGGRGGGGGQGGGRGGRGGGQGGRGRHGANLGVQGGGVRYSNVDWVFGKLPKAIVDYGFENELCVLCWQPGHTRTNCPQMHNFQGGGGAGGTGGAGGVLG